MSARRTGWSRRLFVSALAASPVAAEIDKGKVFPTDWRRFADSATEFESFRLTDPAYTSRLPRHYNRAIAKRGGFLLFTCDRTGSNQVYRMDLKTGETRQLTQGAQVDPAFVALLPNDSSFCYFDGPVLRQVNLGNLRDRDVYTVPDGWTRTAGGSITGDGVSAVFAEQREGKSRLQLVNIARRTATQVAEASFPITDPVPRPRRAQILYREGDTALWLTNFDGQQNRRLRTGPGTIGPSMWAPDGKTILYLLFPDDKTRLNAIRELTPDENVDKQLAPTSQFAHFGANGDTSVFIGASRNKASPHLLLLLRITRRELTIAEHRASDPAMVAPVFSPDSQRIYYTSDRHGKPAIYSMRVERFVEKTDEETF